MTDVIDAPAAPAAEPVEPDERAGPAGEAAPPDEGTAPAPSEAALAAPGRWLLASLLLGAGVIHVAMAPSHLGESAVEGAGFVASAWVQVLLAAAVLVRPTRRVLMAVVAASVVLVAAWAVSRTAGLPFGAHGGHAESVSIVDGVAVGLEIAAAVLAGALLARRPAGLGRARGLALVGALGAVAFTTAAVVSPAARDHAAGSHGEHGAMAGHDDAAGGHGHGEADGGVDPGFAALSNGHQHEAAPERALTTDERVTLAKQLASTADLVERYPTIADAEAAGLTRAGPFSPGLGTHYSTPTEFDPNPAMEEAGLGAPMLVYDGLEPDAPLAGFMYMSYGQETAPEGFAGPNDTWHYHESVCIVRGEDGAIETPFGADLEGVTEQMCTEVGGTFIAFTGYMVHVWNVPGYESPDGMFTELNPRITCPDGTYDRIPIEDLGMRDTVCKNA